MKRTSAGLSQPKASPPKRFVQVQRSLYAQVPAWEPKPDFPLTRPTRDGEQRANYALTGSLPLRACVALEEQLRGARALHDEIVQQDDQYVHGMDAAN